MPITRKGKRVVGDSQSSGHSVGETDRSRETGDNPQTPSHEYGFRLQGIPTETTFGDLRREESERRRKWKYG